CPRYAECDWRIERGRDRILIRYGSKRSWFGRHSEKRRMVHEESRAGDRQVKSGEGQLELAFVIPCCAAAQVDNLNGKLRCFFAGARFVQRQKEAAIRRLPRPHRLTRQG